MMVDKRITTNMTAIRRAVCMFRGGLAGVSDADIKVMWNGLSDGLKKKYMKESEKTKEEEVTQDDDGSGSKHNV